MYVCKSALVSTKRLSTAKIFNRGDYNYMRLPKGWKKWTDVRAVPKAELRKDKAYDKRVEKARTKQDIVGRPCEQCGKEFYPMSSNHVLCLDCAFPTNTNDTRKDKINTIKKSIIGSISLTVGYCQVCNEPVIIPAYEYIPKDVVCDGCKGIISKDEYRQWRAKVFKRDDYMCQVCSKKNNLHAHHKKSWKNYPELRYNIDNGVVLCKDCHVETYNYGGKVKALTRDDEDLMQGDK